MCHLKGNKPKIDPITDETSKKKKQKFECENCVCLRCRNHQTEAKLLPRQKSKINLFAKRNERNKYHQHHRHRWLPLSSPSKYNIDNRKPNFLSSSPLKDCDFSLYLLHLWYVIFHYWILTIIRWNRFACGAAHAIYLMPYQII